MTASAVSPVTILFRLYSDILEQDIVETLWAEPVNEPLGHYQISSIPFYVPMIAVGDLVLAQYDDGEGMLKFSETLKSSGHSNVWVVITDDAVEITEITDTLSKLDCVSESLSDRFFAVDINPSANYLKVQDKLNELRSAEIIDYSISCLSAEHTY